MIFIDRACPRSQDILRWGLAITFIWIGILILRQPEVFGGYLQPWAARMLPFPVTESLLTTGAADIVIGILLLTRRWAWLGAILGSAHLVIVLIVSGITDITVRDIGLLAGTLAIAISNKNQ